MKGMVTVCLWTLVTLMVPSILCKPGGYGGGAASGYSSGSSGYGSGSYGGPKSSAADALKASYNNQNMSRYYSIFQLSSETYYTYIISHMNVKGYNYNFGYDVQDNVYKNYQSRQESGSGDPKGVTKGSYTVVEPDGSRRTVNYVADWVNGFRATVSDKNGVTQHGYNSDGYGGSLGGYGGGASGGAGDYAGASKGY